ncbi:MAG: ABC transporter substrate-binding protein [Actinobacteria bacterium]|nr:ABC transporter substrate-binding protein [Actinomycetota bacterium]
MRRTFSAVFVGGLLALTACTGGSPQDPIRIGAVYPLSGTQGPGGVDEFRGVEVAVRLANEDGGVRGRPIELVPVDVPGADAAPGAIEELEGLGVRLILGSYGSTISAPAAEAAARRGLLFWETGAVGEMTGGGAGELVFRVAPSGAVLGRNAIRFVADEYAPVLGRDPSTLRYAVTLVHDAYGRAVARGGIDEIRARGFTLAGTFAYDPRTVDMEAFVGHLATSEPDVVFVSAYLQDAIDMRREMVRQGLDILVGIGTSSSYCMPAFGAELGDEAVGLFASDKPDSDALNVEGLTPSGRVLLERAEAAYEDRFGEPMSAAALAGFSGAWALLREVLPHAAGLAPEAVAAAANATNLPPGSLPNGSGLRFGEAGTVTAGANLLASSVIWQWQAPGSYAVVSPDPFATSETLLLDPLP